MGIHIRYTLSWRQVQDLNRENNVIIYPEDTDEFESIHLTREESEDLGSDDAVWIEVADYTIDRLNKGAVTRETVIKDDRVSTIVLEPEEVQER